MSVCFLILFLYYFMHLDFIYELTVQPTTALPNHSFSLVLLHTFPGHFNRNTCTAVLSCNYLALSQCPLLPQLPVLG